MEPKDPKTLGQVIVETAYCSARAYLVEHELQADNDALFACIKSWCKIKLPEAITDARAAYDRGMNQWGDKTFTATFVLAGIEAAKEVGMPTSAQN